MSIKLVAIDIDGTLLNSAGELTKGVKDALQTAKKKGVRIVLCTGRPLPGVKEYLNTLDLLSADDYVITYNGSLVQNVATQHTVFSASLTKNDYLNVNYMAQKLGVHFHVSGVDAIFTANRDISPYTVHESTLVHMPIKYRTSDEMVKNAYDMIKMMMIDEPDILDHAITQLPLDFKEQYNIVKSAPFYLEILHKGANKGIALAKLAEHLNIAQAEVMAIGDNENDMAMLEYAGVGVAMQNAVAKTKAIANYITASSNDEDGVKEAIEKFC
ncbi:sugar phosphate phosphatase [Enterococcus saigonensis]|uniref:Sugar phosphate phosphatase n=1 Tax=Enterococcus saigonensis TaxID=1805431 RepID=A0A679I9B5_9ENTE|nr:sugar-phosphatase [Enterococcus saigonensis]BCA86218.1 sugar phosphate phosphatase [Enterococcus saigonensis]